MKTRLSIVIALILLSFSGAAQAQSVDAQYRTWLDQSLWPDAKAAGVSRATFDAAFKGVTPNLKLPDLVLPGQKPATPKNQHQAEFGAPGAYFAEKTIGSVQAGGRARASEHARTLRAVEQRFGVPSGIVLAIWGRESGFGRAKIPYDAIEVLSTKAFLSTRKDLFRKETLAALQVLEKGWAAKSDMKSSWAGALGQPQFLPSSLINHAVDMDGDGRRDIWTSVPDTLGSIANYLAHHGWQTGRDWGFEVTLPRSIACSLEGPDRGKSFADWAKLGAKRVSGSAFPAKEMSKEGFLLLPAGTNGPAFIVTPNFYVLKDYNTSDLYALFVGNAADRITAGGSAFKGKWGSVDKLYRSDVAAMQRGLEKQGYDVGGADGLPGYKTRRSIGEWQAKNGMTPTCFPSADLVKAVH
ncbi:lytic murein transglycosylase [Tianweitania sp. BSSL-BM11]|uniref:Lytic murein transglycosylase n=1 Tax=Tianweitania aestuarii TaxID=2814886 RepID=A0ABS5RQL9_9HYPH|nr:lytic murein transglycosylase [Tianweitania aestuarii]MBS9719340.1 lytic murein transglycosylase [Tianweitania aestuarii]